MKKCAIGLVRLYQRFLSPLFHLPAIYSPTCSNYMIQAGERHGLKGILMGLAQILRCHPWSKNWSRSSSRSFQSEKAYLEEKETRKLS